VGLTWTDVASLATAGGTLVLAVATFGSVRSANRAARAAERSLLAGLRPVLIPSREDDPVDQLRFGDGYVITVAGHGGAFEVSDDNVYFGLSVRNGGAGLAVIHGWRAEMRELTGNEAPSLDEFRRQSRDIYVPAGDVGFWQGAIRDSADDSYDGLRAGADTLAAAAGTEARLIIDLLYGDQEGGQRTIVRFGVTASPRGGFRAEAVRYWNVDGDDPR
jgi:hypothetical protein